MNYRSEDSLPQRYVIDFALAPLWRHSVSKAYARIEARVLPIGTVLWIREKERTADATKVIHCQDNTPT